MPFYEPTPDALGTRRGQQTNNSTNINSERAKQAQVKMRPATCPVCSHVGAVSRRAPGSQRLRCTQCGAHVLIRHCVGPRPTKYRKQTSEQRARSAAAREVLARYCVELDDGVTDLWHGGVAS
jgi:hypothetical protein